MKFIVTSIRIKILIREKIKRIYGLNLREFIEVSLELLESNQYFKNKLTEKIKGKK